MKERKKGRKKERKKKENKPKIQKHKKIARETKQLSRSKKNQL